MSMRTELAVLVNGDVAERIEAKLKWLTELGHHHRIAPPVAAGRSPSRRAVPPLIPTPIPTPDVAVIC
jgi:hypothetical protein